MPELTVHRTNTAPPPMVCMYCGAPGTVTHEWQEENRRPEKGGGGGGTNLTPVTGDDPVSLVIGLLMLPFVLWELLKGLAVAVSAVAGFITRPASTAAPLPPAPPPPPPKRTRVVVTACPRHRRFRTRFVWAGVVMLVLLIGLWAWALQETRRVMGTDDVGLAVALMMTAIFSTCLLPIALSTWYAFGGPVIVERVTESTVVLDRVRQAYFDATGITPNHAEEYPSDVR